MQVVLTRAAHQVDAWRTALQAAGHEVHSLPLIEMAPVTQARALAERSWTWQQCAADASLRWDHIMWVSANAVEYFLQGRPVPSHTQCWATGGGTVAALLAAGALAEQIKAPDAQAAQWDSEHLWQVIKDHIHPGERLLVVRGSDDAVTQMPTGRNWLAQTAAAAGLQVHEIAVYVRQAPAFSAAQMNWLGSTQARQSIWLFSSSQAVQHLPHDIAWTGRPALATHPRIAQAATARGFVTQTCAPYQAAVLQALAQWLV
jgi:uroporphyrinogen-III synthase